MGLTAPWGSPLSAPAHGSLAEVASEPPAQAGSAVRRPAPAVRGGLHGLHGESPASGDARPRREGGRAGGPGRGGAGSPERLCLCAGLASQLQAVLPEHGARQARVADKARARGWGRTHTGWAGEVFGARLPVDRARRKGAGREARGGKHLAEARGGHCVCRELGAASAFVGKEPGKGCCGRLGGS